MIADGSLVVACGPSHGLHRWRLGAAKKERAPFVFCAPVSAHAADSHAEQVRQMREIAEQHLAEGQYAAAAEMVDRARATPGYRQNPKLLKLCARAACGGRIVALRGAWQVRQLQFDRGGARCIAPLPRGSLFLTGQQDGSIALWDADDCKTLRVFSGHSNSVAAVAVSSDGRTALSSAEFPSYELRVWDLIEGACLRALEAKHAGSISLALNHNGRFAVRNAGYNLAKDQYYPQDRGFFFVFALESGEDIEQLQFEQIPPKSVALSPDGTLVAAGGWSPNVQLYDLGQGGWRSNSFEGHSSAVACVSFSADGQHLLSASYDQTMILWDVASAKCLRTFRGHKDGVTCAAFSPNGHWVLSGSKDRSVRLWDLSTGDCIRTLESADSPVTGVAFSGDSRFVVSLEADGTVRVFQIDWDLEFPKGDGSDEALVPHLRVFLSRHTPLELGWRTRQKTGPARWNEQEFHELLADLRMCGLGWLRPEAVRLELEKMATGWN